jgi:hypothetical protein
MMRLRVIENQTLQKSIEGMLIYKAKVLGMTPEFQALGWVDLDWWETRMLKSKFPKEYVYPAVVAVCKLGFFEMFLRADCPHCLYENRYKENVEDPHQFQDISGSGLACQFCGKMVKVASDAEIDWEFKMSDHMILDKEKYFSSHDDLADIRKEESAFKRLKRWFSGSSI